MAIHIQSKHDRIKLTWRREINLQFQDGNGELTKEEFLRGAREDQSVIDVLSLYQRDAIAQ